MLTRFNVYQMMYDDMTGGRGLYEEECDPTLGEPDPPTYYCGGYEYKLHIRGSMFRPADIDSTGYSGNYAYYAVIVVYDLTSPHTWDEAVRLQNLISADRPADDVKKEGDVALQVMVLGLKTDIQRGRWVSREDRESFARQHGTLFAECSARTGEGVHEAMEAFVEHAHETIMRHPDSYRYGPVHGAKRELLTVFSRALDAIHTTPAPLPDVYRHWRWLDMVEEGRLSTMELDYRRGTLCIALWGPPGVGKTSMVNRVRAHVLSQKFE